MSSVPGIAQDLGQIASLEAELAILEAEQQTDPHARFRYWHDLTECWNRSTVYTRYHSATVDSPRGRRSSWAKARSVKTILHEICVELGEDFDTFTQHVCQAVHERPRRVAELQREVCSMRERLADGRLLLQKEEQGR